MKTLLSLLSLALLMPGCRKEVEDDASLKTTAEDVVWYDSEGNPGSCEPAPPTCQQALDPQKSKEFITTCVEDKKGRAQTCGCTVKCTAQWEFGSLNAKDTASELPKESLEVCTDRQQDSIAKMLEIATVDDSRRYCAGHLLCEGINHKCPTAKERDFAQKLRSLAKGPCRDNVVNGFCPAQFADSLSCKDNTLSLLSHYWTGHINSDKVGAKTCLQSVLCNDRQVDCKPRHLKLADKITKLLNEKGCEYWRYHFCKL